MRLSEQIRGIIMAKPTRITYDDRFSGEPDEVISKLLGTTKNSTDNTKAKRMLIRIIQGELTQKQQDMIMMYYFGRMTMQEIADNTGISVQAVSAVLARARNRIYRVLRYYFEE